MDVIHRVSHHNFSLRYDELAEVSAPPTPRLRVHLAAGSEATRRRGLEPTWLGLGIFHLGNELGPGCGELSTSSLGRGSAIWVFMGAKSNIRWKGT